MRIYVPKHRHAFPAPSLFAWAGRLRQGAGEWAARLGRQIAKRAEAWADAVQQPSETDIADVEAPLHHWKRHTRAWLLYMAQRARESNVPSRCYRIAFASLVTAILLTYQLRGPLGGDCALFFLGAVVVSAGTGGLRAGLLSLVLSLLPYACFLSYPLATGANDADIFISLILFALMAVGTCILSDTLFLSRQQAETARQQAETQARRARFLAQASAMLDDSQDYESLLSSVTRAIVPGFAEGAVIDLLETRGETQTLWRAAVTHLETEKEDLLRDIRRRFPFDVQIAAQIDVRNVQNAVQDEHPLMKALRTRQAQLIADVTGEWINALSQETAYLELMNALEPRSLMVVPLVARNRILGALTFLSCAPDRRYTPTDLVVAKDLASRVALAIDNLRLYHEAQQEITERAQMEQKLRDANLDLERKRLELVEANIRLCVQASTDGLTGLNNHRAFQEELAKEVQRALRYRASVSLVLLDVDKFKQYNDTYGHPAGDRVLKQVASVLQTGGRHTDFTARYGGEEFVVILPDTDAVGAQEAAERLRQGVEGQAWEQRAVTASFGVSTLSATIASASELIAQADKALYHAKRAGRNRVTHADALVEPEPSPKILGQAVEAIVSARERPREAAAARD